jgi:hypothetical protein
MNSIMSVDPSEPMFGSLLQLIAIWRLTSLRVCSGGSGATSLTGSAFFPLRFPLSWSEEKISPYWSGTSLIVTARKVGKKFQGVNQKKIDLLQSYAWPGSIREFQNVIERSVIVCETENFSVDDESWLLLMQASRKANWSYLESSWPKRKR